MHISFEYIFVSNLKIFVVTQTLDFPVGLSDLDSRQSKYERMLNMVCDNDKPGGKSYLIKYVLCNRFDLKEFTLNSDLDSFALEENQASDLPELLV